MAKRALILNGGTMRGAFLVGALKTIHRMLGVKYFDAIFATSVGVFEQAFFASGQIYFMENTWREYVHGNQLINLTNPFRRKPILDLDYLTDLFQSDKSRLDVEAMKSSHPKLFTFLTDYETRKPILVNLKEGPLFDIMRATCALPIVYPKKIFINKKRYIDSWLATREEFSKLIEESLKDYDEVVAISANKKDRIMDMVKTKNIIRLKPEKIWLWKALDTNRARIIKTIEQGEKDAERFILENNLSDN